LFERLAEDVPAVRSSNNTADATMLADEEKEEGAMFLCDEVQKLCM